MAENSRNQLEISENGLKWLEARTWLEMAVNGGNSKKRLKMAANGMKLLEIA